MLSQGFPLAIDIGFLKLMETFIVESCKLNAFYDHTKRFLRLSFDGMFQSNFNSWPCKTMVITVFTCDLRHLTGIEQ